MNKRIIFTTYLILFFSSVFISNAVEESEGKLNLVIENVEPQKIEPGNTFQLSVRLYNDGTSTVKDVDFSLDYDKEHFTLIDENGEFGSNENICFSCNILNTYYFKVNQDLSSGEYPIKINAKHSNFVNSDRIVINVLGKPDVLLKSKIETKGISAGENINLEIEIENVGSAQLFDLKLSPKTEGFIIKGGESIYLPKIQAKGKEKINLELISSDNLQSGPTNLEFSIEYSDDLSNEFSITKSIGINLIEKVKMNLVSAKTTPTSPTQGSDFDLNLRIENLGEGDAKNVKVKILSEEYEGEKLIFMGTIDEEEDVPAILTLNSKTSGQKEIEFEIEYTDDLGVHKIVESYEFNISKKSNTLVVVLVLFVVLAVGFFSYRKFMKKE